MIINASTGTGFGGAISYVHKEQEKNLSFSERPQILQEQNVSGTIKEQAKQMRFVSNGNTRASRPVLHLSVSFSPTEKLSPEQIDQVLKDVVKEVGATPENNQYVVVKHNDSNNEHYHIVLNKVGFNGNNIDTSYIKNKCQVIADKLEQKHDLQRVKGRTVVYDSNNEKGYRFTSKEERTQKIKPLKDKASGVVDKKTFIQEKVKKAMNESKSLADLDKKLEENGIETKFMQNVNGLAGVSFRYKNQAVKGSEIGIKAKEIKTNLERNSGHKLEPYKKPTILDKIVYEVRIREAFEKLKQQRQEKMKEKEIKTEKKEEKQLDPFEKIKQQREQREQEREQRPSRGRGR